MLMREGDIRIPSGCAIAGIINREREVFSGHKIVNCIANMHSRSNGLGGGFAAYGIYPDLKDYFAFHLYYDSEQAREECERILNGSFAIRIQEPITVRKHPRIDSAPLIWRYFAQPKEERLIRRSIQDEEFVAQVVMTINATVPGAFVVSSGKNMGAFKGVGYPEDIGEFFRLDEYEGYLWTAHGRFPTNTPGWWGGAHPFTLLDWSVVHNGEVSSYDANRRFLEMNGYRCTLQTDTEVITYTFDLLMRKHGLALIDAIRVVAPDLWEEMEGDIERQNRLRRIYSSLLLNGPFSIIVATNNGMVAVNDRIKLRPLVAASKGNCLYVASEEAAIRAVEPDPEQLWSPRGGEPVMGLVYDRQDLVDAANPPKAACSA